MATPKPALRLAAQRSSSDVEDTLVLVPGKDEFINSGVREQYVLRLEIVRAEMVSVPGLREVTDMALERATFFYYKMRDLELSGVLSPKTAAQTKLWFGIYDKLLTGWVKINDELYRQARQIDHDTAFKQSFINQVSTVLRQHLAELDPARSTAITVDLAKLVM